MLSLRPIYTALSVLFLLFYCSSILDAQVDQLNLPALKAEALKDFNEGNYQNAMVKYESLLNRYPKDGNFHYYYGVSLLRLNRDFEKSAKSLEYATTRPGVPTDALYYLGQVYLKSYRFSLARSNFEKYSKSASRQELRALDPSRKIFNAENAISFTKDYNSYEIIASSFFTFSDSTYTRQVRSTGGKLVKKPSELLTPGETEGELVNFMFLPKIIDQGDYVYFAGYSRNKKGGTELFRAKLSNGKRWGSPEPLTTLNTEYDEILPYYDPVGRDLYFASRGHNSMGGFDVFKAHFDDARNSWSEPVNLGFPLNSPYDDLLLIPGSDLGSVLLITERQGRENFYAVYSLQIQEPRKSLAGLSPEELERIGNMGGVRPSESSMKITAETFAKTTAKETPANNSEKVEKASVANQNVKSSAPLSKLPEGIPAVYQEYIKNALAYQFSADSLSILARDSRLKAKQIPDPNQRWELQKDIIEWEKGSRDAQAMADEYYAKLKELESASTPKRTYPSVIEPDTVISGLTVYRYTDNSQQPAQDNDMEPSQNNNTLVNPEKKEKMISPIDEMEENKTDNLDRIADKQIPGEPGWEVPAPQANPSTGSRFLILDKSPYSVNNPIPVDVPLPKGPFYQIQLGVFSQQVNFDNFGGISPVTGETVSGKNMTRYYAGKFDQYQEAVTALDTLKKSGYNDAFIVSWFNGQKMPPARVKELEGRE